MPKVLTSEGIRPWLPGVLRAGQMDAVNFPLLRGPRSLHTLLREGSHFLCFQRDVFQASCAGAPARAACRGPAPAVIPGGKRAGRNVQDGGAKKEASPQVCQQPAWGGGQGRGLGGVQQVLRESLTGTIHSPRSSPEPGGRQQAPEAILLVWSPNTG